MEKVVQTENEVLYLNKNNIMGLSKKSLVDIINKISINFNLEDVDCTLKIDDNQFEKQKNKMNKLLEYYIENRKEKSEEYEEDMCEFIVLQPIKQDYL